MVLEVAVGHVCVRMLVLVWLVLGSGRIEVVGFVCVLSVNVNVARGVFMASVWLSYARNLFREILNGGEKAK